jgi:hypothetical protein
MSSRAWNMLYRHGLVRSVQSCNIATIHQNLLTTIAFCKSVGLSDIPTVLDWDVRLYDMAHTGLAIAKVRIPIRSKLQ